MYCLYLTASMVGWSAEIIFCPRPPSLGQIKCPSLRWKKTPSSSIAFREISKKNLCTFINNQPLVHFLLLNLHGLIFRDHSPTHPIIQPTPSIPMFHSPAGWQKFILVENKVKVRVELGNMSPENFSF